MRRLASLTKISQRIANRETSAYETIRATLDWISRVDPLVHAQVHVLDDALDRARQIDRSIAAGTIGPLAGVPVGVKDLIDVTGFESRAGLPQPWRAPAAEDASIVRRLREAGAVVVSKTVTHELAYGVHSPPTRNPWDTTLGPGGSSGGSAVAVATGMAAMALGTDTAGSVRIPAALCGTVGFKPTFETVPTDGVLPLAWSLDHVGWLVRDAADVGLIHRSLGLGTDAPAVTTDHLVVGIADQLQPEVIEPRIAQHVTDVVAGLADRGARIERVELPSSVQAMDVHGLIMRAEASSRHHATVAANPQLVSVVTQGLLALGETIGATAYLDAQRVRRLIAAELDRAFEHVDVLVAPTTTTVAAPPGTATVTVDGREVGYASALVQLCVLANLAGVPAVSIPFIAPGEPPCGVQLIGPRGSDQKTTEIAAVVQRAIEPTGLPTACADDLPDVLAA